MKKIFSLVAAAAIALAANAQTLNVEVGKVTYAMPSAEAGVMPYADAANVTIMGKVFTLADVTRMYVDFSEVVPNTVEVVYDGAEARVRVAGNLSQYLEPTVSGAHVSIVQGDVPEEVTYKLSGATDNGQFYMEGGNKAIIHLNGVAIANTTGAAIDVQNSKLTSFVLSGANTLTDCADGSQKGCFVGKGQILFDGAGSLDVYCNTGHAIYSKKGITMKNCTLTVHSAVKDGVNCNQYFVMESGTLNVSGVGDDGVQVSFKDDVDREADDIGTGIFHSGIINVSATATAAKAIKADGDLIIEGGTFTLSTTGGGMWDEEDVKTKGASCLNADQAITINGGTINMTSTGSAGKGISCDTDLTINGGDVVVHTSGKVFAYINGKEYDNYTGNTDNIDSDYKSSPKGIKADGNIFINGGNINITTTGNGGEGIESKAEMTINDGVIVVNAYDDGLNSSSHMWLNGGDLTVVATNNDAIDSNGDMYIAGGTIRAFGGREPECGLDANDEEGYKVYITGGTIIASGGRSNSTPASTTPRQPYITLSSTLTAGATVTVSAGSTELGSITIPSNYSSSSSGGNRPGGNRPGGGPGGSGGNTLISLPGMTSGTSYTVAIGSTTTTATAK